MKKVFLISIDGLRPELIDNNTCKFLNKLSQDFLYVNNMRSMIPPITLPCFFSIFFGINPLKHGVFYNIIPDNYKVNSPNLFEILTENGIKCRSFFNWETLEKSFGEKNDLEERKFINDLTIEGDIKLVEEILSLHKEALPEFLYLYLGALDEVGHKHKWMSKEYTETAKIVDSLIEKLFGTFATDYDFIIHSDHGGYEYGHYVLKEEIMKVPFIYCGREKATISPEMPTILDISPTILSLFGIKKPHEWEGKNLLEIEKG